MTSPQDIKFSAEDPGEEKIALLVYEAAEKDWEIQSKKCLEQTGVGMDKQSFIIGFIRGRCNPESVTSFNLKND